MVGTKAVKVNISKTVQNYGNVEDAGKRSFHRELLKLNYRIALSNEKERLTEFT